MDNQRQEPTGSRWRLPHIPYKLAYRLWMILWLTLVALFFSGWAISIGPFEMRTITLDWAFIQEWWRFISQGVVVTIALALVSIIGAAVLALLSSLAYLARIAPLSSLAALYVSLFRGTPLFLQLLFVYLALPQVGLVLDPFPAAAITLSMNYGAYMSEIFRAGIQAVGLGQREAAHALGMTSAQMMRRIVLPQAFRIIIPDIGNQFIALQKDTSLASAITLTELAGRARQAGAPRLRLLEALIVAAAWYWLLTLIFSFFQEKLERRLARADRRSHE